MAPSPRLTHLPPLWWGVLCSLPVLGGLAGRFVRGTPGFEDFDAVTCAGLTLLKGGNPYDLTPACAGLKSATFVYAPPVVEGVAFVIAHLGADGYRLLFGGLWLLALCGLSAYAVKFALPEVDIRLKLPLLALFTGGCIACGNIAILLHGVVLLGALSLPRRVWPFVLTVTVVSLIKPVLLTYLIVLAYMHRPLRWRLGSTAAGVVAGLSLSLWVLHSPSPLTPLWKDTLSQVVLSDQTGISYFGWLHSWGIDSTSPVALSLLPVVMGTLALSGLALAELGQLSRNERLVLGMGLAQLLNPRLMDYDLLLVVPFGALLAHLVARKGGRWASVSAWGLIGLTGSILVLNEIEQRAILPVPLTLHLITLTNVALAVTLAFQQRAQVVRAVAGLLPQRGKRLPPLPAAE